MGTRHWPEDADEYVEELEQQLAKANERIAELERENKIAKAHLCLDKIEGAITDIKAKDALNKFAIEQKIEGIDYLLKSKEPSIKMGSKCLWQLESSDVESAKEQLRKEQENV